MIKNEKPEIISVIKEMIDQSTAVYLADYSGIPVEDINGIRNQFRNEGVKYKVFKNTLFKRALDESGKYEKLADHLVGMTGYVFASENERANARKEYDEKTAAMNMSYREIYEVNNIMIFLIAGNTSNEYYQKISMIVENERNLYTN